MKVKQPKTQPVVAYSFDMDGCLMSMDYYKNENFLGDIIRANLRLLNSIRREIKENNCQEARFFIGSARQDIVTDFMNTWDKDRRLNTDKSQRRFPLLTAVETIERIANHFQDLSGDTRIVIDKTLLADIINNFPAGTSYTRHENIEADTKMLLQQINDRIGFLTGYQKAIKEQFKGHPSITFNDVHKCSFIYTQVHKLAIDMMKKGQHNAPIVFNFYDDRMDIINAMRKLFEERPDLLPRNVTLNIHEYRGKGSRHDSAVKGTGRVDMDFASTVRDVARKAQESGHQSTEKVFISLKRDQQYMQKLILNSVGLTKRSPLLPKEKPVGILSLLPNFGDTKPVTAVAQHPKTPEPKRHPHQALK